MYGDIDDVYAERNFLVASLARIAASKGYRVGISKDSDAEEGWSNVIYIDLPTGQVSWHVHEREMFLFDFLPEYNEEWDGHDTVEKYRRVLTYRP